MTATFKPKCQMNPDRGQATRLTIGARSAGGRLDGHFIAQGGTPRRVFLELLSPILNSGCRHLPPFRSFSMLTGSVDVYDKRC